MDTALAAQGVYIFHAVELLLPSSVTIRLVDGSGVVTFSSKTFTGKDATYGTLGGIESFTDGVDAESPHLMLNIIPPTNAAGSTLATAANQGSTVNLWFGALGNDGTVQGTPDLKFTGEIDVVKWIAGKNSRMVQFDIASVWDRFFDVDEGITLSNAWLQSVATGSLGLEYVTDVQLQIPWGTDGPRPNVVTDVVSNPGGPGSGLPTAGFGGYGTYGQFGGTFL